MQWPILISSLLVLLYCETGAGTECSDAATSTTQRLKRKLLCNYDPELRPVKHPSNVIDAELYMSIESLIFHDKINTLEVRSSDYLNWQDEHLTWDKNEYGGMEKMAIVCSNLWVPDVGLTSGPTPTRPSGYCLVDSDGKVESGRPVVQMVKCVPDISRWPFDVHTCALKVGSWTFDSKQLTLSKYSDALTTEWYKQNRHWVLQEHNVRPFKQKVSGGKIRECLIFTLILQRHPGGDVATILVPAIVFVTMTLASFWLEPQCNERLGLLRVNIACHCMYLIYLGMKIPGNGDNTPVIITFFRDSLLLAGISLLVSLCAERMNATARTPPMWITFITNAVVTSRPGQLLLLGDLSSMGIDATAEAGATEDSDLRDLSVINARGWRQLAVVIDRLCFLAYTLVFLILICGFIPHSL